ncbi:M20/M25/M40 family metallo-hydrolase [Actinoallomurus iriomotensis]|uniref:Amidohydrolase n=1 Tax=Actinoallomurus iriomotensis TaxID=478107 RepID=A0A9W6RNJ2_9ACTN|nr:M20/M25/M40 family metallo-hydrolase [Actinoallomurus iriomotensis]GLY78994.1 amidohydrolase [Actinoallomurus iriomotensis]
MRALLAAVAAVAITGSLTAAGSPPDDDLWLADHLARTTSGKQALAHLRAFERIADENGGQRATATPGFAASARYVTEQLTTAGYQVKSQTVPYRQFVFDAESGQEIAPHARTIRTLMMDGSPVTPKGGLTAPLVFAPVKADGTSGCTAADYDGLPVQGAIVLAPRSSCGYTNQQKVIAGLGGRAMLMYLPVPDPENIYRLHVFTPSDFTIPSATISPEQAGQLSTDAAQHPITFHLELRGHVADKKTVNLFAETRGGSADHIVMAGAHLDSVPEGPGIDDNASSVAALLETARRLAPFQNRVRDKVRFAFWGAEEQVDVGSDYYVEHLSSAEKAAIDLYENFELIASPNFARFLIDGDVPEAPGSATVTKVFEQYFTRAGLPFKTEPVTGVGSDQAPFVTAGIAVGGMDMGTIGLKTPEEAAMFGGQAGQQYDHCYHQTCDRVANLSLQALDENVPAIAWTIGRFAMDTSDVR